MSTVTHAELRGVALCLASLALLAAAPPDLRAQTEIVVAPDGAVRVIGDAVRMARPGDRVVVRAGVYREPTIVIDKSLELVGEGWPVLDGEQQRELITVLADDVTVRGLHFRNVGASFRDDRAAVRVTEASGCTIEDNRFDSAFFGIYLASATDCRVARNTLRAFGTRQTTSGNGIHLWSSSRVTIVDNEISGHRDGIYLEFSDSVTVVGNRSTGNHRYGLHFMFSDDCAYRDNRFSGNGAGVAVMYAARIAMTGNTFDDSKGDAAYGLLLKDITDASLERNRFTRNTTALLAEGTTRLVATRNRFDGNGWAIRLDASAQASRFVRNEFLGNTFDVATNSSHTAAEFAGNYWDRYAGYDLDRDGVGDVPHRPVRLFAVVAARFEPTLVLLRSFFVDLLESAERLFPSLTPTTLYDGVPAMRPYADVAA